MSIYPPTVSYFARRILGVSTNVYKIEPNGSADNLGSGQIISFELPTNTLLNLKEIKLLCGAKVTGGTKSRLPNKMHSLIERISVEAGGLTIAQGFSQFNTVQHVKSILSDSPCKTQSLEASMNHEDIPRTFSSVNNAAVDAGEDYSSETTFAIGNFVGFLGESSPSIIDTALLPNMVLKIHLATDAVCSSSVDIGLYDNANGASTGFGVSGSGTPKYTLNKVHLLASVYGIMDGNYDRMIEQKILTEGMLEIPFKNYQTFTDGQHSGSTRFNLGCQSLDRLYAAFRPSDYATGGRHPCIMAGMKQKPSTAGLHGYSSGVTDGGSFGSPVDIAQTVGVAPFENPAFNGEKYQANYFRFPKPSGLATGQFNINGSLYPQFQAEPADWLAISTEAMDHVPNGIKCKAWWDDNMHIYCVRLNLPDSDKLRILSGLDTRAVNLSGMFTTTGISGTIPVTVIAEYTSTLRVGAGLQLSLVV